MLKKKTISQDDAVNTVFHHRDGLFRIIYSNVHFYNMHYLTWKQKYLNMVVLSEGQTGAVARSWPSHVAVYTGLP